MDTGDDFAATLKKARRAAGFSQAQLAGRAGLTGSYVCVLESRRKPAPSPEVVEALAKALGIDDHELQEKAALDRTPERVRRRFFRLTRERGRVRRTRDRILTTTLFHVARRPGILSGAIADALGLPEDRVSLLGRLTHRVREIRTVEEAASRSSDLLREVTARDRDALVRVLPSLLAGGGGAAAEPAPLPSIASPSPAGSSVEDRPWRSVPVCAEPPTPGADPARRAIDVFHVDRRLYQVGGYLLVAADDDAYPRVERGDLCLVAPRAKPAEGDLVVVRDGGRVRLRVLRRQAGEVRLESPRPDVPPVRMPEDRFDPVGVVTWVMKPLEGMPPPKAGHVPPDAVRGA
jgi:transcriptional regulator with XRE-family HTH domain